MSWCPIIPQALGVTASPTFNEVDAKKFVADGTNPVADGTYTVGKGTVQDGTITVKGGIITGIQEASDV